MTIEAEKFIAARKASAMSLEKAANLANLSVQSYINREKQPEQFRLHELEGVYSELSETAKPIFRDAVSQIFLDS